MLYRRVQYLCALAGVTVFYIAYQEWFSWVALLAVLGLPWLSLLVSLPGITGFRAVVECPDAMVPGGTEEIRLVGTGRYPVPPFSGRLRLTRCTTGEQWIFKKDVSWHADHCGGLLVCPEKAAVYDYLGLFRFRIRKVEPRHILVRPRPVRPEAFPDVDRYLNRAWRPKPGGGFAENHELRLYRPGDSLNLIHWKLTAKTGKLMIREAMEPERGLVLLTMDLSGTARELDDKFGQLLWLGTYLLSRELRYEIRVLTGGGLRVFPIAAEADLKHSIDTLLCCPPAAEGSVQEHEVRASWRCHIGGGACEA